ncbi:Dolichyl-diphosphooligosaccharide-protein glycosyltransferase subunit dad1 [Sporothrix epigloea]|uniref:DASH complex subunit DAD1 n=1 Tax=Sporothrix epigloea TaxID=1892477 RepID=A0ABP0DFW7_9PEZI
MAGSRPAGAATSTARKSYFEQQRELLLVDIATSFEQVLANMNKLNRSLEAVVTVGNEFSAIEALWSQFEGVMAKEPEPEPEPELEPEVEAAAGGEGSGDDHTECQSGDNEHARGHSEDNKAQQVAAQLRNGESSAAAGSRRRWKEEDMDIDY